MTRELAFIFSLIIFICILGSNAEQAFDEKAIHTLKTLPRDDGLILLNGDILERYIMPDKRNFSLTFIVASKKTPCEPCEPALEALSNIAQKWELDHKDSNEIFFGFLDYVDNYDFVRMLGIETAPLIFFVAPDKLINDWEKVGEFQIVGNPTLLAEWISKVSNLPIKPVVPMNKSLIYLGFVLLLTGWLTMKVKWFRSAKFVGILCLTFICTMLSGFMWVNINGMPLVSSRNGKVLYFYPQNGAQFGAEVLVVMSFYAMISGGVVLLTNKCPKYRKQSSLHLLLVLLGLGLAVIGFNQMAQCYTKKTGFETFHFKLY